MRSSSVIAAGFVFAVLAVAGGRGFRTQHLLEEHFAKYGHDFGNVSLDKYLRMAQQLRDARPGKNILEAKRTDGSAVRLDRRYGWFVAYEADGTIRTFFVPKDGARYFELQKRATTGPE